MTSPENFLFLYILHFAPLCYITTQVWAVHQALQPPETVRKTQPCYLGSWMSQESGI